MGKTRLIFGGLRGWIHHQRMTVTRRQTSAQQSSELAREGGTGLALHGRGYHRFDHYRAKCSTHGDPPASRWSAPHLPTLRDDLSKTTLCFLSPPSALAPAPTTDDWKRGDA